MRSTTERSVECVRVTVREPREDETGELHRFGSQLQIAGIDGRNPPGLVDADIDVGSRAGTDPRPLAAIDGSQAMSLMTAVSARTPAWQSSRSACSWGECETPVGLRTKIIAVSTPADARMPAS